MISGQPQVGASKKSKLVNVVQPAEATRTCWDVAIKSVIGIINYQMIITSNEQQRLHREAVTGTSRILLQDSPTAEKTGRCEGLGNPTCSTDTT